MHSGRPYTATFVMLALALSLMTGVLEAQKKKPGSTEDGYIPVVVPPDKQKKDKKTADQTLPPPKELPSAVTAETDRLTFDASSLSAKGLLTPQTRDALRSLLRTNRGTIVALRAFVAGSGDLRRIGELVGEAFTEKHQPLPVLTVVQVGGLPMTGAQVLIEATEMDRRVVNPHGLAFLSGAPGRSVAQSVEQLQTALRQGGMGGADVLRATCFVSALDDERDARNAMATNFPSAVVSFVQMQRGAVEPQAVCEAAARLKSAPASPVAFSGAGQQGSAMVLVSAPRLVFTGTQLAFGREERDAKLAFDHLDKVLGSANARMDQVVKMHVYLTSGGAWQATRSVRANYWKASQEPAVTALPVEGLPSLDAVFAMDAIAATGAAPQQR